MKKMFLLSAVLLLPVYLCAQVNFQYTGTLKEFFTILQNKYGYKFMYSNSDINDKQTVFIDEKKVEIEALLQEVCKDLDIVVTIKNKQVVLRRNAGKPKDEPIILEPPDTKDVKQSLDMVTTELPVREIVLLTPMKSLEFQSLKQPQKNISIISMDIAAVHYMPDSAITNSAGTVVHHNMYEFDVCSNLLYDVLLIPNAGMEVVINKRFGISVNSGWTHINWDNGNKCYRLWFIAPEIRLFFSKNEKIYVGAMFQAGQFNMKFSDAGYQGDLISAGITAGYIINLSSKLKVDVGIGLGYNKVQYDSYIHANDKDYKKEIGLQEVIWGLTKAGFTLKWKLK